MTSQTCCQKPHRSIGRRVAGELKGAEAGGGAKTDEERQGQCSDAFHIMGFLGYGVKIKSPCPVNSRATCRLKRIAFPTKRKSTWLKTPLLT